MIYRFEMKKQLANTLIWSGVISLVLLLLIYGFYPIFLDSCEIMEQYMAGFPPEMLVVFGFNADDMFSFQSFSGMVYLYESVLGAIMIASCAVAVFGREKKDKCRDFLMTKPVVRGRIFVQKLLCCLTLILTVAVPYMVLYRVGYMRYSDGSSGTRVFLSALCLPLTMLVFMSFGIFAAVFMRRVRSESGAGVSIGLFAFLLAALHSLTEKDALKFISPLYYFSPETVIKQGGYSTATALTACAVIAAFIAAAYIKFTREDIAV